MGRGLSAILSVVPEDQGDELRTLPVDLIDPNPDQPRQSFDDEALAALAESLKANGLLQPVLVRPAASGRFQLVAGERRWRAAKRAGIAEVPALVRAHDDAAALELALVENMAREDLNPVEEARACAALVEELGLTQEEVGRRVGRSRVAVSNLIRLLDLPDDALELIQSGDLTEGHGRAVLMAPDHAHRRDLARAAATNGWSVRETEAKARATTGNPSPRTRRTATAHPDQLAAATEAAEALSAALGADVKVTPRNNGYRATIDLEDLDTALTLAARITRPRAA
jgi:ParB family chromosome partitioning protein